MNKKVLFKVVVIILTMILMVGVVLWYQPIKGKDIEIHVDTVSNIPVNDAYQIFYLTNENGEDIEYCEERSVYADVVAGKNNSLTFILPYNVTKIRVDLGMHEGKIELQNFSIQCGRTEIILDNEQLNTMELMSGVAKVQFEGQSGIVISNSTDPYFVWDTTAFEIKSQMQPELNVDNAVVKVIVCAIFLALLIIFLKRFNDYVEFPVEIYHSKRLILQLSKNDFKTKYAGSYLGIVWAFVQPIITVLVYWFVFEKGFRSREISTFPFVLWLIAGLIPWFFFSDALNGGTNALTEYQYLVKKVVFQIDILPIVKVLSAMYVHIFFVGFMLVLSVGYGYCPDLYTLQILYYSFCIFILVLGISYLTSAVVVFFRDLTQIINIVLQVGVWMTPIMWNMADMGLPNWLQMIFKANPMYYVVEGYRDALLRKIWFWERPSLTLYFWGITFLLLGIGTIIFKKLKVHFADVL